MRILEYSQKFSVGQTHFDGEMRVGESAYRPVAVSGYAYVSSDVRHCPTTYGWRRIRVGEYRPFGSGYHVDRQQARRAVCSVSAVIVEQQEF